MLRAVLLLSLLAAAPAGAQQAPGPDAAPEAGVVLAYMEGCLESSASQGPEASRDFCKCTAKAIFSGGGDGQGDPAGAWMQCSPGMRELFGGE